MTTVHILEGLDRHERHRWATWFVVSEKNWLIRNEHAAHTAWQDHRPGDFSEIHTRIIDPIEDWALAWATLDCDRCEEAMTIHDRTSEADVRGFLLQHKGCQAI